MDPLSYRRRILLVEDDRDCAEALLCWLGSQGHEARHAADGASALSLVNELSPHVVLLDIVLPDMDGYELCSSLRKLPEAASARMVAMSGFPRDAERESTLGVRFDEHLLKPFDLETLRKLLEAMPRVSAGDAAPAAPPTVSGLPHGDAFGR